MYKGLYKRTTGGTVTHKRGRELNKEKVTYLDNEIISNNIIFEYLSP